MRIGWTMYRSLAFLFTPGDYAVGLAFFCLPFFLFTGLIVAALVLRKKGRKIAATMAAIVGFLLFLIGIGMIASSMNLI